MAFFKPVDDAGSSKLITRLHHLIWILVYGGLLTLVLGLSVQRTSDPIGWSMVVIGAAIAALGFLLIYLRSKINTGP